MAEFETPSAKARRERLERIWPAAKPKAKRKPAKAVETPVEPIPDEADDGNGTPIEQTAPGDAA